MASALVGLRCFAFGFFIICNTILCSVGVWNLSLVEGRPYNVQISAYVIFLGALGLLFIFPVIFLDLLRHNAYTSRIWVELIWVTIFWLMELAAAAALTAIVPNNHCRPRRGRIAANVCLSGKVLLSFAWVITLILLAYLVALTVYTIIHNVTDPNVWNETVREYPWFASRSTLSSSPPSPTTEKGPGAPSIKHPRPRAAFNPSGPVREPSPFDDPAQPVPTFDRVPQPSYQPGPTSYEGARFAAMQDPVPIMDPALTRPRQAPRPPIDVRSLYPEHMQAQLPMDARDNLYRQSRQLQGYEPSPIGDWPRNSRTRGTGRRQPPPPFPRLDAESNPLTQLPLSSASMSGTTNVPSPAPSRKLGSPTRGPQRSGSIRRQPPPPLNLDGISNTSHHARR